MIVVAVDPGEVTGFACYDTEKELVTASGELFGSFRACVDYVRSLGDFFVLESFRVRPDRGPALAKHDILWPVEWLGAFRYLLANSDWTTQTPSQRTNATLQLNVDIGSKHELDALLHLQYWLDRQRPGSLSDAILSMLD